MSFINQQKAYRQKVQAQIDQLEAEFMKMRANTKEEVADKKIALNQKLDQIQEKINQAKENIGDLANRTEDNWEEAKQTVQGIISDISNRIEELDLS